MHPDEARALGEEMALTLDEARDAVAAALAGAGPFGGYQTARRIEDLARAIARQEIAALSGRARSRAEDASVGPVTWRGDPPDRIRVEQDIDGFWTCRKAVSGSPEFIRVDLYEAALRSRDAIIVDIERRLGMAREVLMAVDWTVTAHGKMDVGTPLHDRVRAALEEASS